MTDKDFAHLMNNGMIDGFQSAGLNVPAADPALPIKETRSEEEAERLLAQADSKRVRKQRARALLARRTNPQ